jgi:SAM-dependent methyltransferase
LIEIRHIPKPEDLRPAYEEIYGDQGIRHSDSFYDWIFDLLKPEPGRLFLDIACGQGRLPQLAARYGLEAHGLDLSVRAIEVGLRSEVDLLVADGQRLPYPAGRFHYLTNIGSLEHYVDPVAGAQEMARVLAPGGLACILLPNAFSLLGNVLYALHEGRTADDGQPIQRYAARFEWQDLLQSAGLRVIRTHKYECERPRSWADLARYLRRPKALARLLLTPFIPLNLANSFVYICQKGTSESK